MFLGNGLKTAYAESLKQLECFACVYFRLLENRKIKITHYPFVLCIRIEIKMFINKLVDNLALLVIVIVNRVHIFERTHVTVL